MISDSLFIGSTGAGKTNALLYWLRRPFSGRGDLAFMLSDPHGDAAVDLVGVIPKPFRGRVTNLDQLDKDFASWVGNAYEVGDGIYLKA